MRVLIDTNILLSAAYLPGSVPDQAYKKAVSLPYKGLVCEQSIEEMHRIFNKKFPDKMSALAKFLDTACGLIEVVIMPHEPYPDEGKIRDKKDRPILRAAINAGADIILTGDKDFTESSVKRPMILTAAQFLDMK